MEITIPRTNNFWIDNGIVVLGRWLWDLGFKEKNVKLLPSKLKIEGVTNEEFKKVILPKLRDNYLKERRKRFLSPFIRQYTTGDPWIENLLVEKNNTMCFFCGRPTSKAKHLKLNRAVFPFANIRFPAFLSNRSEFPYVCSFCYVLGRLGAFNAFFLQGD